MNIIFVYEYLIFIAQAKIGKKGRLPSHGLAAPAAEITITIIITTTTIDCAY